MKTQLRKKALTLAVAACLGVSGAAMANDTASAVKGQITGPNGNPAAGTKITIIHVPSGSTKNAVVNESGLFSAKGLRVGGPYQIIVDSDKFEDTMLEDVYLTLGNTYPVNVALNAKSDIEQIVVTGRPISSFAGGTGPSANFGLEQLENAPAINRDLKDIVRADPRIFIDESRGDDAIQCGGGNPRFNSLTLDGVRMNDNFGLNDNGYPTVRTPFSYDAIDQVAVELAPFDVNYGGFTSCNFNAVTKSGTNEVHGRVFFDYTNDSMTGDKIEGKDIPQGDFSEKRYGFSVGAPLIEDKLFIFVAYEELEGVELFDYPKLGDTEDDSVSTADLARIVQIAKDKYNYDAGTTPTSMPVDDQKLLVKLDWNINDDHRASVVYNYNDGFKLSQSDDWAVTLDSHFYERGAEFTSVVGSVYSDWTDNFSTEVRIGKSDVDMRQQSLDAASSFGEVQINHNGQTVFLGPDDSRQSNDLDYDTTTFKVAGTYYLGEHEITGGYEFEEVNVFNLFMQHTQGEFRFRSIDDFEAGLADRIYYNNSAGTNNPDDVAANFGFAQHTFYLQDEYNFMDYDLSVTFGLRYDKFTSDDKPNYNANFEQRYGFDNQKNMDGIDLLQPRFGFNWQAAENLEVRGGFGLYSGGNPNVWVSNAYSNDGATQIGLLNKGVDLFNTPMVGGGLPIYEVPQSMYDEIANTPIGGGDGDVNAIDYGFEIPSEWKYAIGGTYFTEDNYIITLDLLHSQKQDSAIVYDIALEDSGNVGPDGRPLYQSRNGRDNEYVLSNVKGDDGQSTVLSAALSKEYDNGINFTVSYAYTNAEDVNPMTSSTSGSNYGNLAVTNPGNPGLATSNYEIPHRFTFQLGYKHEFFDGYNTRFNLLGQASEGRPYSYTYERSDGNFGDSNWNGNRQLVYIPLVDDPKVVYNMSQDEINDMNAWIESEGLTRGQTLDRNSQNADWWVKFDVRISQDLPGFMDGHKGQAYFTIKNVGNLLNDDWGVLKEGAFVGNRMIRTSINEDNQFVYTQFNKNNAQQDVKNSGSLWQMRIGVNYTF
ncbi:carboxypeptidase regulatory-like domain-containing protein [Pseudoalteromonas ulvae]|uniref:TonB-dependent receptor n=1 Tax=Pseudoalteromonas ulvae TaxID=107327 RepID=A0A244CT51_PSEDV|nr:carboxypeptidase regulatory-like domain-containing protein [Pseudoalteromonas ulvae]OUL58785.1 TonB-dependent receptor [Pseudoalteromonas ulvae]